MLEAIADGPVGGPELAERLGCSRAAVWKHVEALRDAGFDIESGKAGYDLAAVPEYGQVALSFGLDAPFRVEYHDSIGSTNTRARELGRDGAPETVVVAERQTEGRGRLDREWASPPGGVWLSVLLRPDRPPGAAPLYTLAAAVAVVRAVESVGVEATIKWPNDVLVSVDDAERKLSGILTEMAGEADRIDWVVLGIGINANLDESDLPAGATSLRALVGDVDRRALTQRLLAELDDLHNAPETVLSAWREYASTLGRRVRVETPRDTVVGEAIDVEFPGVLVVETDDGEHRRVTTGDCEHLRPVD